VIQGCYGMLIAEIRFMKILFVSKKFEGTSIDLRNCDPEELVMMVDVDRCISCGSCELACQIENGEDAAHPAPFRPIKVEPENESGNRRTVNLPLACRHCESPCDYYSQYNFWTTCPSAVVRKGKSTACDFCAKRTEKGLWPACATRCAMKTIYFGPAREILFTLDEKKLREMGNVGLCG
jgi:Fe-S-cluster-containing dehydrogenase component